MFSLWVGFLRENAEWLLFPIVIGAAILAFLLIGIAWDVWMISMNQKAIRKILERRRVEEKAALRLVKTNDT